MMYGHSRLSPYNFEFDFGSIQIIFLTKGLQKQFSSMQLLKNIFLDRYKCKAHYDMKSRIPMEFKKMQNKILVHMKTLYGL